MREKVKIIRISLSHVFRKYIGNIIDYVQILPKFHAFNTCYRYDKVKSQGSSTSKVCCYTQIILYPRGLISLRVLPHF